MNKYYLFGEWKMQTDFDVATAEEVCAAAAERGHEIANYPLALIYDLFDAIGRKWGDPNYPLRQEMQNSLPELTGFSPEMIRMGLDEMPFLFNANVLRQKVETEFRGVPRGYNFRYRADTKRILRWHPLGSVLHVLSGNVFLVGPGSFIEGVLTGNVTILKQSSAETIFMPAFIESLIEVEEELGHEPVVSRSVALVEYSSSQSDVIDTFKKHVDGIVVWGGEQAVQAYRNNVPARTRVVVFGPKLSLAFVMEEGLAQKGIKDCARKLALELCLWDQNACTAPQVCFVQGEKNAEDLAAALQVELKDLLVQFPQGKIDVNQAAEIRKWRSIAEIVEAKGLGKTHASDEGLDYTVVFERERGAIEPSPLHRTIKIYPFNAIDDVAEEIDRMRAYIQTVGLYGSSSQFSELSQDLGQLGVLRVMPLGKMSGEDIDDPHDGAYDLPLLMNLVVTKIELPDEHMRPFEFIHPDQAARIVNENFLMAVRVARNHPFYAKRLSGLDIESIDDLRKIPITEKSDFEQHLMPQTHAVKWAGGYVTRSGGTTGEPKFSYFNLSDWTAMVNNAAEIFRSCGFDSHDRMANFLFAGDLYGSFISFNDVNRQIGMTSFPFAGVIDEDVVLKVYDQFHFNAIQGFPAVILPLLRKLRQKRPDFTIEKVMYAGQPMSDVDRRWLTETIGVRVLASVIGTTEAGQLGYQSSEDSGLVHSLIDDYNYIEIVDADGQPLPDGTEGDIVVTSFFKESCPVLRFRIGDRGRILQDAGPSRSGRVMRKLEYLGRADNVLIVGPMNVNYRDFVAALQPFSISVLQLVADFEKESDLLIVNIECPQPTEEMKNQIEACLYKKIHELEEFVKSKKVALRLQMHRPGELKSSSRTGKVKAIIDRRFQS